MVFGDSLLQLMSGSGDCVGKIEVVLSLRTPLNDSAPKMIKEKWLIVEQGARFRTPDKPTTSTFNKSPAPKAPVPTSKSPSTPSTVKLVTNIFAYQIFPNIL